MPAQARAQLEFIFLDDVEQALQGALDVVRIEQPEEPHEKNQTALTGLRAAD